MILPFIGGLLFALAVGAALRILLGMRLNLFLVNHDTAVGDQSVIPITTELKKSSIFRSLRLGNWREDVEITLMDYQNQSFSFRIGFHIWNRFWAELSRSDGNAKLGHDKLVTGKRMKLRTGARLEIGDRSFFVLVTPQQMSPDLHKDLYEELK